MAEVRGPGAIALVPKPTADAEVRDSVIGLLRRTLDDAEAGNITTLVMVLGHPDGEWSDRVSATNQLSEAIGRLEITKQEWIASYLKHRAEGN